MTIQIKTQLFSWLIATACVAAFATSMPGGAQAATIVPTDASGTSRFTLPVQLRAQYTAVGKYGKIPLTGTGAITWNTQGTGAAIQYEASLDMGALFYKSSVQSTGFVNAAGIHPLRTQEKNTGKSATIITINPTAKTAVVTGKDSPFPYDAAGQDLLTVIAQLGTYVQIQPAWRVAGEQKTFTVYRPGGLRSWRFQSQGMQTVMLNGVAVPTVYVMQVPDASSSDIDDQHHFWLDPARHGFPIKLRKTKSGGDYVELTLKEWQEN